MSERQKVSDELRRWCDANCWEESGDYLRELADRIDAEMLELPKDADGVPIHVGDTVYLDDGCTDKVTRIGIGIYKDGIYALIFGDNFSLRPGYVSHTKPDSLESIADELDEMVDAASHADDTCEKLADLADRIRRLEEKENER